jgi:8-oxo-dGTP diphosphatase
MPLVHVVRHAAAGHRPDWEGDDQLRPLTDKGRYQADGIRDALAGRPVKRIVSSPAARCVQTVEPLAAALGLTVERDQRLNETGSGHDALAMIAAATVESVLCSHGDVIPDVLMILARKGVPLFDGRELRDGELLRCGKGSTWELTVDSGLVVRGTYHSPPRKV